MDLFFKTEYIIATCGYKNIANVSYQICEKHVYAFYEMICFEILRLFQRNFDTLHFNDNFSVLYTAAHFELTFYGTKNTRNLLNLLIQLKKQT